MSLGRWLLVLVYSLCTSVAAANPSAAGEHVTTGVLIVKAQVIQGPYQLRAEVAETDIVVTINEFEIERLPFNGVTQPVGPPKHPGTFQPPEGVTNLTESGLTRYLEQLLEFALADRSVDSALELIESYARRSTLVSRVVRKQDEVIIFDILGVPYSVSPTTMIPVTSLSEPKARSLAEATIAAYRRLLATGGAILLFDDGSVFLPRGRVTDVLLPSLRVLEETDRTLASKRTIVSKLWENHPLVSELIRDYKPNKEVWERLQQQLDGGIEQ